MRQRNIRPVFVIAALALAMPVLSHAQSYESEALEEDSASTFAFADVLRADPIYELVQEARPREICRGREVVQRDTNTAGTLVGAVVGAAIGNQVGRGNGRAAATAAGAVAGAAIGNQVDAANGPAETRTRREECEVVDEYVERREVVGFDVQYRYRGEVYVSRLSYDPGEKLRVRVSVEPAEL